MPNRHPAARLLIPLLAALAALLVPASALALPRDFWGVVPAEAPGEEQLATVARGGVETIRVPFNWGSVQDSRGAEPDWSSTDTAVKNADRAGLDVLPFLAGPPEWAIAREGVSGVRAPISLPVKTAEQRQGWREFLRLVVFRYGPGGSFWAENPELPARPIRTWQIWNEENYKYFVARPSPSQYGELVKNSFAALRSADGGARIVLGGLFARPKGGSSKVTPKRAYFATDFLERMYRTTPGVRSKFAAVALHPYSPSYTQLPEEVEELRAVLKQEHDAGKALWITELGWSSGHPSAANGHNQFEKGVQGQRRELVGAFKLLKANQRAWHLQRVYWFSLTDAPETCNFCDGSGLFGEGFSPKPAWNAYVGQAR
jgi:hypothetical protein